jgi:hypothetical protein
MRALDEVSSIIQASQFQLIDPATGLPSLDVVSGAFTSPYSGNVYGHDAEMQLHHHDPTMGDSKFAWSVAPVNNSQATTIAGPYTASTGQPPRLTLEHNGAAIPDPLDIADLRTASAAVTLLTDTANNKGQAALASNGITKLRTDSTAANGGALQLDANGLEMLQLDSTGLYLGPPANMRLAYPTMAWGWAADNGSNLFLSGSYQLFVATGGVPTRPGDFIDVFACCSVRVDTYVSGCTVGAIIGTYINGAWNSQIGSNATATFISGAADSKMVVMRGRVQNTTVTTSNLQGVLLLFTPDSGGMAQSKPYAWATTGFCSIETIASK